MRARTALILALAAALPVFAGDDEGVTLKLLPDAKKGMAEEIGYQVTVAYGDETETLTGKMRREIKALGDDGLPSSEQLEVLSADYRHEQQHSSYGTSSNQNGAKTVKRSGKTRAASIELVDLQHVPFKHTKDVTAALRRDPDGLARAIQPDDKMKVDDHWEVDPLDLLHLFVGAKVKPGATAKATATLESLKKKDGNVEAVITLKAKIDFTKKDDPDVACRLNVEATIRAPIDGSAPPTKEKITYTVKEDEKKLTTTVSLERAPAEKDDDDDPPAKEEKPKKEKK